MSGTVSYSRRDFIALGTGAALSAALVGQAQTAAPAAAPVITRKLKLGLIGCGGRGSWIANLFKKHGGYDIVAVADYFQSQADKAGEKLGVPSDRRYSGLSAYKRLLAGDVEAIAVESPPYFHPEQAAAGVAAGKHVYCAKPVAVDVPGCQSIAASGKQATAKKLCFLVDFQSRSTDLYIEALQRVHAGAIGNIAFGESTYHAECPFSRYFDELTKNSNDPELRLRAWGLDRALSGDIITEQNIHTLDVMNWVMTKPPIGATGTGGITARAKTIGTCFDHFTGHFDYGDGLGFTFSSRQIEGHGTIPAGIRVRAFGSKGVLETEYGGTIMIRGAEFFKGGKTSGIYQAGAEANIAAFYRDIIAGNTANTTVEPSVQSNLITILGRTAAYTGQTIEWSKLIASTDRLEADLKGLKD
jgi:predicted dehydrogenase